MKKLHILFTLWMIAALLAFPITVLADGGEGRMEKEVNGYHVALSFVEPAKSGANQFHVQLRDAMDMPVMNAEVEVEAMPVDEMDEHESEAPSGTPSVGVMTGNNSMDDMGMTTGEPSTGVMKPNNPSGEHGEEVAAVTLAPTEEEGEYAGEVTFEKSGEWMFNIHFTVDGVTNEVEIPFEVARPLGVNYGILVGFFGINATAIAAAAVLKRKSVRK